MVRKKKHKTPIHDHRRSGPGEDRRGRGSSHSSPSNLSSRLGHNTRSATTEPEAPQPSTSGASAANLSHSSASNCDRHKKNSKHTKSQQQRQESHALNRRHLNQSTTGVPNHLQAANSSSSSQDTSSQASSSSSSSHWQESRRTYGSGSRPFHCNTPRVLHVHPSTTSSSSNPVHRMRGGRRRRTNNDTNNGRGRRAGRQPWRDHSNPSSARSSPATVHSPDISLSSPVSDNVASSSTPSNAPDLPGFYFDPVKKKYFKILAGHQGAGPSTITRESLHLKATEEARQRSLREFALRTIQTDPSYGLETSHHKGSHAHRSKQSRNIADHVYSLQQGVLKIKHSGFRQSKFTNHQLRRLQSSCKQKVLAAVMGVPSRIEHMTRMLAARPDSNSPTARMVCLWSLKTLLVQRIQLVEVNRVARVDGSAIIDSSPVGAVLTPSLSKVTDMCWAQKAPDDVSASPVLYTTTCIMGTNPSLAKIRHLGPGVEEDGGRGAETEFHLGNKTTWSCAWSAHAQKFSVGLEECAFVLDVATRRLWELHTRKSDVLTQTFSRLDANTLYSGTRKGEIMAHDLRSSSTRWVSTLNHRSPLSHLHMMQSGHHLLASDFSGSLRLWDLRTRSVVQEYREHNNEYTRIPFCLDDAETVICAAGQDCYTRVWDVRSTELLVSIPPPYPASRDLIPAVCIYASPTGHMDRPGILMGIRDELHLYTC